MSDSRPIAFFDSGLGGISVLRETVRLLPEENYLYYGDSLHAPYGVKTVDEVTARSRAIVRHLLDEGAKAIVIACNTATSAAANTLRAEFPDVPIIGTEPALKPAVERHPGGRILVMATAMTLNEKKFDDLRRHFLREAEIHSVACSGLMEFVERGELSGAALDGYLREKLAPYLDAPIDAIAPTIPRPERPRFDPTASNRKLTASVPANACRAMQKSLLFFKIPQDRTKSKRSR